MITPRFQLSQTTNTISIEIRAPYCSLKELEVDAEEEEFMFTCKPYYLRLILPGKIVADESPKSSSFNSDDGLFMFTYEKANHGEDFPDLDLITKLLCKKVEVNDGGRKIEVLSSTTIDSINDDGLEGVYKYGFAMRGGYNLSSVLSEFAEVFEIDPHEVKLEDRTAKRVAIENKAFNRDYYIADMIDNDEIMEIIRTKNPWVDLLPDFKFNTEELDFLKDLQNVEYILNVEQRDYCFYSLLEILYAYCYDRRTTFYEGTCESGWAVNKLSASLCFFEGFSYPKEAVLCGFKRTLIYPLYRNFDLSSKVLDDLKLLLKLGDKFIIRCLIELHGIFLRGDGGRYVLNNLFIKDYIRYVMKWDKEAWNTVVEICLKVQIEKSEVGLDLPVIEDCLEVIQEETLEKGMGNLNLDSDDDSESNSDDSESDSSEEGSSSSGD